MSVFTVNYWRKGKEQGKRGFIGFFNSTTYERVLFDSVLGDLCESTYSMHYESFFLNNDIFIKRTKANGLRCEYTVRLFELGNRSTLLSEYEVEIECLENDNSIDLFLQEEELKEPKRVISKKTKQHTEWFRNETRGIKWFLIYLHNAGGSLRELKNSGIISKATYHRNLNACKEKGYIKNDKLVKRIFVTKYEN
ncbi:hypothetical protein [Fluviicola sp.]|uniref:hypothetical protein n=1 Tax=Fluviicola sp. TaxID=1917219 RepID=UPI003D26EDA3